MAAHALYATAWTPMKNNSPSQIYHLWESRILSTSPCRWTLRKAAGMATFPNSWCVSPMPEYTQHVVNTISMSYLTVTIISQAHQLRQRRSAKDDAAGRSEESNGMSNALFIISEIKCIHQNGRYRNQCADYLLVKGALENVNRSQHKSATPSLYPAILTLWRQ